MKAERAPLLGLIAGLVLIAAASAPWPLWLIWNRTGSVPTGLYTVSSAAVLARGDLVAYRPSRAEAAWIEARGYTGKGWPLIKRIAALEGDEVCRFDQTVRVNGAVSALALDQDASGAELPAWSGCRRLGPRDIFLLADHPRSIDGRYFGVQPARQILGRVARVLPAPNDECLGAACGEGRTRTRRICSVVGIILISVCAQ
ncbi:MAG: S26 family signal peptidase [Pannonibacter sp.]